jgi:hypothetical protein
VNPAIQSDIVVAQPQRKRNAIQGAQRGEGAPGFKAEVVGD